MPLMLNTVQIAGNLTRDPEVRFFANDKAVANFGLAINRRYKGGDGEMKEETTFVDVECWGRQAELVGQYLTKGRNCLCEGSLKFDQWEDKEGNKRSKLKINAQRVHFIGKAAETTNDVPPREHQDIATGYSDQERANQAQAASADGDDESPF